MNEMINHASTAGKVKSSSAKIKDMSKTTNRIIELMNHSCLNDTDRNGSSSIRWPISREALYDNKIS